MSLDVDSSNRRVPSLVNLCQRVGAAHVDSISSLGDDLRYPLVKPILERCNVDQLLRLEYSSPHLQKDTPEIWQKLCIRKYPTALERYPFDDSLEPGGWKDRYFFIQEAEAKRLEEVGSKLRSQRLEADERKKEREVKLTDKVPPSKRPRGTGWTANPQPKTLFQKTRTEASKLQKIMYNARILPPMPTGKNYRILPQAVDTAFPSGPSSSQPTRVTVNTVIQRRSVIEIKSPTSLASTECPLSGRYLEPSQLKPTLPQPCSVSFSSKTSQSSSPPPDQTLSLDPRPLKAPLASKRDPMACLFVPKHRAYSQRPA